MKGMLRTTFLFFFFFFSLSLFHTEWGVAAEYTMELIPDSYAHSFLDTSRSLSDDKLNWGLGLRTPYDTLVVEFDFITPPWTSYGVEFQAYYTPTTEGQFAKGSSFLQKNINVALYNSDLAQLHSKSQTINFTTFPQKYTISWDNIRKFNSFILNI